MENVTFEKISETEAKEIITPAPIERKITLDDLDSMISTLEKQEAEKVLDLDETREHLIKLKTKRDQLISLGIKTKEQFENEKVTDELEN